MLSLHCAVFLLAAKQSGHNFFTRMVATCNLPQAHMSVEKQQQPLLPNHLALLLRNGLQFSCGTQAYCCFLQKHTFLLAMCPRLVQATAQKCSGAGRGPHLLCARSSQHRAQTSGQTSNLFGLFLLLYTAAHKPSVGQHLKTEGIQIQHTSQCARVQVQL